MASTTQFSTTQSTNPFNIQNITGNTSLLGGYMGINQFLPQSTSTGGTTTKTLSPTQGGGLINGVIQGTGYAQPKPTVTGFTSSTTGSVQPTLAPQSVWSSPTVTTHPATQNTGISSLPPTPPATSTNNTYGAPAGGGQPFSATNNSQTGGVALPAGMKLDANGNMVADTGSMFSVGNSSTNMNQNTGTGMGNGSSNNPTQSQSGTPSSTSAQTNAIISNLNNIASQGSQGDQAEIDLQNQIRNLETSIGLGVGGILSRPEPLSFQTGQQAALLAQRNPELQALTNQLASLQANRAASIGAASNAGGLSNNLQGLQQQTQPVGIGTGLFSPFSNQTVAQNAAYMGGVGGGTNGIISGLVDQLKNGAAWSDVVSQLPSAALAPMLSQAATQAIPGFNPTTSNQNASARNTALQSNSTQGLTLQRSADSANKALDTLDSFYSQLPGATTGGIPATNSIATWIGQQFGNTATSQFETALQDARAQLEGVLTSTGAATPTGAEATAKAYLPDGMTPDQFKSKIDAAKQLVQQKVASFTQTGNVPQYQNGTNTGGSAGSSSIYNF